MTTKGKAKTETHLMREVARSASAIFVIAIVVMINYLGFRHYQRFDWTSQGIFTLSPKSKEVLRELEQDVDVYLFMSRGESSFMATDELLKRYQAASSRVHVHYVDPDREPTEFKLLAQRFGISAGVIASGEARADVAAVVSIGDKNWHVDRDDLVAFDYGPMAADEHGEEELNIKAEQALTGAIVQVTSGRATKVCVTSGHGEWSLSEGTERPLETLKMGLRHDNIEWQAFETLGKTSMPDGCDAALVLGPLRAFSATETKLLLDYLRGGGNLLLALDPIIENDQILTTGFEEPLREIGVRLDRSLVLELSKDRLITPNVAEFLVTEFSDHETTRPLQHAARVFMALARSVTPDGSRPDVETLVRTSDAAFGETNIAEIKEGADPVRGPGDIACRLSLAGGGKVGLSEDDLEKKPGGRFIVVGDSEWLDPQTLATPELANFHLASAWIGYVTERPALIAIPPKKVKSGNVVFTSEDLYSLFFRVVVLVPGAAFLLGLAVWLNRRS